MKKNLFIFIVCLFAVISNAFAAPAPKHEFRGMWTATVTNLDWPSTASLSVDEQKAELVNLLDALQAGNVNAVCLQVRSLSDALYKSSYEPWAACLTGTRGKDPGYDPLAFAIEETHKRGMELHAWVNPFRVTSEKTKSGSNSYSDLPITDKLYDKNPALEGKIIQYHITTNEVVKYGQIMDPGYPEVREHIVEVLMEIVKNYDIDGLLMDDYFYPSVDAEIKNTYDSGSQESYYDADAIEDFNKNGSKLDDWRRQNVDKVIEELSKQMRANKPWVRFGMGPFGIWSSGENNVIYTNYGIEKPDGIFGANYYTDHGCNTVEWIKQGWVDYVNPQLYWPSKTSPNDYRRGQDYHILYDWWSDVCTKLSAALPGDQQVQFYPSHSVDRVYDSHNWGVGEMRTQVGYTRTKLTNDYSGSVFFSARYYLNLNNWIGKTHSLTIDSTMCQNLRASHYQTKALVPPMEWKSKEVLEAPSNLCISTNTLTWEHATATRFTVYIYPKGIEMKEAMKESAYLQMVVYGNSFALPASFDVEKHNIAVCSYDRYGVEHSATEYEAPLPDVTYVLNGGILGKRGVPTTAPTQEELWKQFREAAKLTKLSETLSDLTVIDIAGNSGLQTADQLNGVFDNKWGWLKKYIMDVQNEEAKKDQTFADGNLSRTVATLEENISSGNNLINWRYSVAAFFKNTRRVGYPNATADFSTAGKREAWKDSYETANSNLIPLDPLPEKIVDSDFLLPRGKPNYEEITHPSGCNFLGWFDNPDMTGEPLTTLPVGYTGTVYAKWSGITWMLNGGKYTGEGTLPTTVDADYTLPTAAEMARPAYVFGGWYEDAAFTGDALTTISANYTGVLHAKWIPAYYVTWHPDHCHDVSNEDLWQLFMEDYNEWYYTKEKILPQPRADQPITNAIGFTFPPEETREDYPAYEHGMAKEFLQGDPRWQWLDKYITDVIEKENKTLNSNAPLWTAFKEATGLTHLGSLKDITSSQICGKGALFSYSTDNGKTISVNDNGSSDASILTALFEKTEWKWLKKYIQDNRSGLADNIAETYPNRRAWAFAVAAFFKQENRTTYPTADFSTAGKHSVWKNSMPEEYHHQMAHFHVTSELDYRRNIHAFFNHSNVVTYPTSSGISKTEGTADFTVKGQPKPNGDPAEGWYQPWWDATFPEYMAGGSTLPKVARKGYVFAGWYCGTNEGYYFKPEARMNSVRGYDASNTNGKNHLWARWYELCLYEGYVKKDQHSLIEDEKVNHNLEMIYYADATTTNKSLKISIDRKFLADGVSYSTLVLPFAIPRTEKMSAGDYIKQITNENGEYVFDPDKGGQMPSILVCQGANKKTVNGEDMVEFGFKELDVESKTTGGTEPAISAYVPFLIKPKKPISARLQFWAATVYYRTNIGSAMLSGVELRPVLAPSVVQVAADYSSLILVDKNRLAQVYQDGEMLGLRGYFVVKDEWANLPAKITIRENVTTDVEEVVNTDTKVEVQKVMRNNRVYIIREGHTYDILGNKVE